MEYFDTAFVMVMIVFPTVFTLFIRRKNAMHASEAANIDLAAKQRSLWLWTAAGVLGQAALLVNGVQFAAYTAPLFFFPLWFLLALPVLQAKDPGWRGVPRSPAWLP